MYKVKSGDLDSMTHIFNKYNNRILNYFFFLTGKIEDSQDLTQEVFLRLIKYRKSFNRQKNFKSWLYHTAKNILINYSNSKHNKTIEFDNLNYSETIQSEIINNSSSEDQILYESISKLPFEYKEIIVLSKFQGLKYKQIAVLFSTTEASIKNKMLRALNKLREIYFKTDKNTRP
ncbi:MAG: sigma-70 family RNA polymerase sigma factor [Bacteroidales bacterium]|nr:MAG: sigma-70 family RNA polymerase sigma factor [Bacteroidales bacterium]